MAGPLPWLAVVVLGAGLVSAGFIRYLWPYRDRPGGWFFIATIASETLWTVAYGLALFVFDPALRPWFEVPIWIGVNFIGVSFLAFALEYTGRSRLVRSPWMAALVGLQVVHTLLVATNPLHGIAWTGYEVTPFLGAATVTYTHTLWLSVNFAGIFLTVAAGAFLLFDAFFSYGRLYRLQAAAIALSPVLPGLSFFLWLVEVGVSPPLNLTPLTFPLHLGFVFFAFFRRNMFELAPAARRAADRAAVEDLPSAVIVVDDGDRVIDLNAEARRALGVAAGAALGEPLEEVLPDVDPRGEDGSIALSTADGRRDYAVTTGALRDAADRTVGHTIVLQDITAERAREQRLGVLNRVLRHNLRNDLNVVQGYVELARDEVGDDDLRGMLATAGRKTGDVIELGEKARRIEETVSAEAADGAVELAPLVAELAADLEAQFPAGTVAVDVPEGLELAGTRPLLEAVFRNLLENGLEHDPGDAPRAAVTLVGLDEAAGTATVAVSDEGPGVPAHELAVLDADEETPLEHGSGLGLWLVTWGVRALGGTIEFEADADGTTATVTLPLADGATSS
ncbi:MAG: histidine kinase N-terminal 7TM domain-containing protein [Halobacteriales archaeon]|nr:histidine kinase N-terminal 7TM domain-containing protein [Halobacteriales archaeon]